MPFKTLTSRSSLKELNEDLAEALAEAARLREADAEIVKRDETIHCLRISVEELQATIATLQSGIDNELCDIRLDGEAKSAEIHRLQQKCEQIPGLMAEAEAHRTLLMERDATWPGPSGWKNKTPTEGVRP